MSVVTAMPIEQLDRLVAIAMLQRHCNDKRQALPPNWMHLKKPDLNADVYQRTSPSDGIAVPDVIVCFRGTTGSWSDWFRSKRMRRPVAMVERYHKLLEPTGTLTISGHGTGGDTATMVAGELEAKRCITFNAIDRTEAAVTAGTVDRGARQFNVMIRYGRPDRAAVPNPDGEGRQTPGRYGLALPGENLYLHCPAGKHPHSMATIIAALLAWRKDLNAIAEQPT